jgi:DNA-binding IclR family transcriptional regulator
VRVSESTPKEHRTVSRVTTILEIVARRGPARMHELAAEMDAPKSSVFGLVKGLVATGYLADEGGAYAIGPAIGGLLLASPTPDFAKAAAPSLVALRDKFDETAMVGVNIGESLIYLEAAESSQLIRYSAPLRVRRPLFPPSAGKVILSSWSARRREAHLASLISDPERLQAAMEELERVRSDGVALNRGETLPDVSAAARAVRVDGTVLGAIAVAGPTGRITPRLDEIARALGPVVDDVARRLGSVARVGGRPDRRR